MAEVMITCPNCGEVQSNTDFQCARCGASLETGEQRKERLRDLEMSRREAERNDVSIQRITGSVNGDSTGVVLLPTVLHRDVESDAPALRLRARRHHRASHRHDHHQTVTWASKP